VRCLPAAYRPAEAPMGLALSRRARPAGSEGGGSGLSCPPTPQGGAQPGLWQCCMLRGTWEALRRGTILPAAGHRAEDRGQRAQRWQLT